MFSWYGTRLNMVALEQFDYQLQEFGFPISQYSIGKSLESASYACILNIKNIGF